MSYKEKPLIKIFKFEENQFKMIAIIDNYSSCSWTKNFYDACEFTIEINYNIPNATIFDKELFVQFGNNKRKFGIITTISDSIGADGKGSQMRVITGYCCKYLLKRRIIKNLNNAESWQFTGTGEQCIRKLIYDQCGEGTEEKRRLPIRNDMSLVHVGAEYTVSEAYSNLYDVLVTIATQSETGWDLEFINNELHLICYQGNNKVDTVKFSTDFESLAEGEVSDTSESYCNAVYVGGKGSGLDRDIYEGETVKPDGYLLLDEEGGKLDIGFNSYLIIGSEPYNGLERFESFESSSDLTEDNEYFVESKNVLTQYGQTLAISGRALAKCPYIYEEQYDVGDIVTIEFSKKMGEVQIMSVTEHWEWGNYDLDFEFGKPLQGLKRQLSVLLTKIQTASNTKGNSKSSVRWYTIPTDTQQVSGDVTYDTIGFVGDCGAGATFKFHWSESGTGAKTYHVYVKQLLGTGNLTLTTGVPGATNLEINPGTYVTIIYVDSDGNIYRTI